MGSCLFYSCNDSFKRECTVYTLRLEKEKYSEELNKRNWVIDTAGIK